MWSRLKAAKMEPNTSNHARTLNVSKLKIWLHRIHSHFLAFFTAAVERMVSDSAVSSKYNLVTQLHLPKIYIAVCMHEYQIQKYSSLATPAHTYKFAHKFFQTK